MALVNAFGYVLLEEELYDKNYVARFTEGLEAYRQTVKDYAPENVEHLTGIPAPTFARRCVRSRRHLPPPSCGAWALRSLARPWMW
jgi:anaerobic selenocysteine-containing dehydrogenase